MTYRSALTRLTIGLCTLGATLACGLGGPDYCGSSDAVGSDGVDTHADWAWLAGLEEGLGGVVCHSDADWHTRELPGDESPRTADLADTLVSQGWEVVYTNDPDPEYEDLMVYLSRDEKMIGLWMNYRPGWGVTDLRVERVTPAQLRMVRIRDADSACVDPCYAAIEECRLRCFIDKECKTRCDEASEACVDRCL